MDAFTVGGAVAWPVKSDCADRGRRPLGLSPAPDDLSLNDHKQPVGPLPADETLAVAELPVVSAATFADKPVPSRAGSYRTWSPTGP